MSSGLNEWVGGRGCLPLDGELKGDVHGAKNEDGHGHGEHHAHQVAPGGMALFLEEVGGWVGR